MQTVRIVCVGKLKEQYWRDAAAEYIKRLGAFCKISVAELAEARIPDRPSEGEIAAALSAEAKLMEPYLSGNLYRIALCIEGGQMDSETFSRALDRAACNGKSGLVFLIGSSHGLDASVKNQADLRLSFSPMTFPHQLARILALEQIYRAFQISHHGRYHK